MNILKTFNQTYSGCTSYVYDFFETLYHTKKYCLMCEQLYGDDINQTDIESLETAITKLDEMQSVYELAYCAEQLMDDLKINIPNDNLNKWDNSEYELYTDKFHHRQFWDEIENHPVIDMLIEAFCEHYDKYKIYTDSTYDKNKCLWCVRLYDLNNFDLYFESQSSTEDFINNFHIDTYTVFSRQTGSKNWQEEYSA